MDEEEDEDNANSSYSCVGGVTFVIVRSNMERLGNCRVPSTRPKYKYVEKLSLLLFALIISNFRYWFTCAEHVNVLNSTRTRTNSIITTQFDKYPTFLNWPVLERRIRHDTIRNNGGASTVTSKRLIAFEPVANFMPQNPDVSESLSPQRNTSSSFDLVHNAEYADMDYSAPLKVKFPADDPGRESTVGLATAEKFSSSLEQKNNCSCFGDKKNVSRAFQNLTISVQHKILNTSQGITAGIVYQVIIKSIKKIREIFLSAEDVDGFPAGIFLPARKSCLNTVQIFANKMNDSEILLNWSLPTTSRHNAPSSILFRLCYQFNEHNHTSVQEIVNRFSVLKGCEFYLRFQQGSISSSDLFTKSADFSYCSIIFSNIRNVSENFRQQGLIVKLTRLNVQCNNGNITFSFNSSHVLCGKLEEIPLPDREYYFPHLEGRPRIVLRGRPVFAITYEQVDFCYNVSLTAPNDSVIINPLLKIFCNFKISLPYGYRADVSVSIKSNALPKSGVKSLTALSSSNATSEEEVLMRILTAAPDPQCPGILLRYWDGNISKVFCQKNVASVQNYHIRLKTEDNLFRIRISSPVMSRAAFYFHYEAIEITDIVGGCGFGAVSVNSFCVNVIDNVKYDWSRAEEECVHQGGHLASILDEQSQRTINSYLLKSPNYQDYNSYWIGASDIGHEGEFRWADSLPFSYTNWFGGWPQYGYYNRQPNDDGFSSQDCVELRRQYRVSSTGVSTNGSKVRLTPSFTWNDRDCRTKNYFLCEFLKVASNVPDQLPNLRKQECNHKVIFSEDVNEAVISTPDFPQNYPHNKNCVIDLNAPLSYKIVLVFEEFVLEDEPNCSYDYLEIYESTSDNKTNNQEDAQRFCGDWSDKLKLLRYVSTGPRLYLRFVSDYSHSFSGYKAHVSIEQVNTECPDNRLQIFNGSCYLFVSYPQVTWQTAQDICSGVQGTLATIHSLEEQQFVVAKIRESHEYTTSTIYWLGGKFTVYDDWKWVDNTSILFNAWVPMRPNVKQSKINKNDVCLGIQWIPSPSSMLPSGLYWVPISCQKIGGYVCKIRNIQSTVAMNLNSTANGTQGELTSPNFPGSYYHNLDYWVTILGPENTRVIIQFHTFDLEEQKNCLYDYVEIYSIIPNGEGKSPEAVKYCGHYHTHSLHRLNFVSSNNNAVLRFHSDYSISGSGFSAIWKAVDISGCPVQTLTAKEGIVTSPNYPNFLLANLQCTTTILAPVGRQVWFELTDWDFYKRQNLEENTISDTDLYLFLSNKGKLYPLQDATILTDGVYLSYGEYMRIHLKTGDAPNGRGFKGTYKTISELSETRVIYLNNNSTGNVYHLNFPLNPVPGLNFIQRFVAPLGYSIYMQFHQVIPSSLGIKGQTVCQEDEHKGFIEVRDHYADRNGTWWQFCEAGQQDVSHLTITSYLNTITVKQISNNSKEGVLLNASLSVVPDPKFKSKILQFPEDYVVESCLPNPCHNNGKCISDELSKRCECIDHFTGLFCALTICDINPCIFGVCELTPNYFKCVCQSGYEGNLCDKKMKPCSTNPCGGRGECIEKNNFTFMCQCHAWWEGEKCEKKIANIPYKPLTDRMLEEPFWLGLLTVFIVLGIIGLVWCARRHFPEKLEKLLAEEAERNRHYTSTSRTAAVRGDMVGHNGVATAVNVSQPNTATSSPNPRTLLGRLGIRKPSLFSLTSPLQPTHTARTFSLDDLFKPSSSRSQMSYKHRSNASHHKISLNKTLLKKQSSSVDENKLDFDKKIEIIELQENAATSKENTENSCEETSFIFPKKDRKSDKRHELNNKYEKKVHFARLMNKVQAEISSYSDVDVGLLKEEDNETKNSVDKPLAASTQTLIYQPKSPHSTSSNQGSDSLSSSEMTLISASGEKLNSRRPSLLTLGANGRCQKAASADSILAMFRKFSLSTGQSSECNSNFVSASTSPTASSPQDEFAASEDSSLSSFPISVAPFPGVTESPPCVSKLHSSTVQVSVLDPMNSQKSSNIIASSNLLHPPTILLEVPNKCLSPIHEVPTPSPSPSMTPIMPRHHISSSNSNNNNTLSSQDSLEVKNSSKVNNVKALSTASYRSSVLSSDTFRRATVPSPEILISTPPYSPTKSIDSTKNLNPVIPTFNIQEASPLDEAPTIILCPGTPPLESQNSFLSLREDDKPSTPPIITITYSGEIDSDPDFPNGKCSNNSSNTMIYLSPFSMCSRSDRTASESNLSSSGYSSMASPCPSRCGSNNPLCPSETEDQTTIPQRPSSLPCTTSDSDKRDINNTNQPSDSETFSDEHQMESNDEGFNTDQLDEKIKQGELKSAKELELFIENEQEKSGNGKYISDNDISELDFGSFNLLPIQNRLKFSAQSEQSLDNFKKISSSLAKKQSNSTETLPSKMDKCCKSLLQLPSIVVDPDKCLSESRSPVSSRSESPLSDRTVGVGRFSPMFYGRLTDSDGVYDWTSSDCLKPVHRKHFGRKREKHRSKSPNPKSKLNSPLLLNVPGKVSVPEKCRKPSPKRRMRSQIIKASSSSSSSSENTETRSQLCLRRFNSPYKVRYLSKSSSYSTNEDISDDDTLERVCLNPHSKMSEEQDVDFLENQPKNTKTSHNQRLSIIEKISNILSHEKKSQWKTNHNDPASIPLLLHSQSVEKNCIQNERIFHNSSKKSYSKSNGLTD